MNLDQYTLLNLSKMLVYVAHCRQEYGDKSYYYGHIKKVVMYVHDAGVEYQILAYLHDILEDTFVTKRILEKVFGNQIAKSVYMLTDEKGKNRRERKQKTYAKQAKCSYIEKVVKVADRLVNIETSARNNQKLFEMYKAEHTKFKNVFYQQGLCDSLWEKIEKILTGDK